jgi:hypothetical protein
VRRQVHRKYGVTGFKQRRRERGEVCSLALPTVQQQYRRAGAGALQRDFAFRRGDAQRLAAS